MSKPIKSEPIKEVVNIDRVFHEPARLAILLTLEACEYADFKFLQAATGLTMSNLSLHLIKLEEHQLVEIEKTYVRKTPRTLARLSKAGKAALDEYRAMLEPPKSAVKKLTLLRRLVSPEPEHG